MNPFQWVLAILVFVVLPLALGPETGEVEAPEQEYLVHFSEVPPTTQKTQVLLTINADGPVSPGPGLTLAEALEKALQSRCQ